VVCFAAHAVPCTLLALTDLAPEGAEGAWYDLRSGIEDGGFKDTKRGGWAVAAHAHG
jgi:hypothetical protein